MSNMHPARLSPLLLLAWTYLVWVPSLVQADDPRMRLRLKDGSFSRGTIVPSTSVDCLGWKADGFARELEFDLAAVRSVTTIARLLQEEGQQQNVEPDVTELPPGSFYFDLTNGSLVAGQLLEVDEEWVTVKSALLGELRIERGSVRALSDAQYVGQVLYRGPVNDQKWQSASEDDAWTFEAGALRTSQQGAVMIGDVGLPAKAQVNIVLAWEGVADFVFSFGTTATNKVSTPEQVPAAARLEVWDKQLALVREVDGGADIALVSDLTGASPRIELSLFIDQEAGVVTVCDSHGRPLDSVKAVGKRTSIRNSVHLVNHGPALTLEHFEVREWDGLSTQLGGFADGRVIEEDGTVINGAITGFDPESNEVLVREAQSEKVSRMALGRVRRADFLPSTASEQRDAKANEPKADTASESDPADDLDSEKTPNEAAESEKATSIERIGDVFGVSAEATRPQPEVAGEATPTTIELILADRTRLRGQWLPAREGLLRVRPEAMQSMNGESSVVFPSQAVRGVIGNAERYTEPAAEARIGTLKLDETQLAGYLEVDSQAGEHTPLHWHPTASLASSPLLRSASGAIVYRKALPTLNQNQQVQQRNANRAVPMINIFLGGKREQKANKKPDAQGNPSPADLSREILFRTGDAIEGLVERVDERGLTFKSEQTSTTFAAHEQVQSVSLNRQLRTTKQTAEKLQRLMTVPRSKKQDPPTHLFVSVTGDYLRGRLVRIENGVVTVEVRLEQLDLPAEQVAKIIWLHDREWDEGADEQADEGEQMGESKLPFRVHVIGASERGLTFVPQEVRESSIVGVSELLGDCSAPIEDANQILFGRDIATRVREYREDPWTLSLAQYPRVYLEQDAAAGGAASVAGKQSPLVGNPAPAFGLETLRGERFRLQNSRPRVVVLDFWASWCGPCVQTMPLVEQAIDELDDARLQLVAVNIQEAPARVLRAVESLGLDATVVLDVDGEVAAAYQANAIPQTVIIDPQGVVTHVFVGGGNRMVAQFKEALQSVLAEADKNQAESQ